jgi:hypothetical protein
MRSAAKDRWLFTSCSQLPSRYMCCYTNVTSAPLSAGWGLAWLSPILGSILYAILGINRMKRRANLLRDKRPGRHAAEPPLSPAGRDDHLAPLERAGDRITQHRAERDTAVTVLHNGDEAYPKMIAAIEAAKASIALTSFIFRADDAGGRFIDTLVRARRRRVQVRVLIDGMGSGYFLSPAYQRLRRHDVPVLRFMHSPLPWRMPFLDLRTHKKIVALDGRIAFTGGLNIGDENPPSQPTSPSGAGHPFQIRRTGRRATDRGVRRGLVVCGRRKSCRRSLVSTAL